MEGKLGTAKFIFGASIVAGLLEFGSAITGSRATFCKTRCSDGSLASALLNERVVGAEDGVKR